MKVGGVELGGEHGIWQLQNYEECCARTVMLARHRRRIQSIPTREQSHLPCARQMRLRSFGIDGVRREGLVVVSQLTIFRTVLLILFFSLSFSLSLCSLFSALSAFSTLPPLSLSVTHNCDSQHRDKPGSSRRGQLGRQARA